MPTGEAGVSPAVIVHTETHHHCAQRQFIMFQTSILRKYLRLLNEETTQKAFAQYTAIFLNPEKQENIRNSSESQYQEGFCRDLFCQCLGYTINPEPGFNLKTEQRNQTASSDKYDNRKADAAIILNDKVVAVIELKGCDTLDLNKVENQAFGYKIHNPGCRYVIISNFERLRFYIDDASDYLEFNLFSLSYEEFKKLYLILALEQLQKDAPAKLKAESLTSEKEITASFYKDYSGFKRKLFENICKNNLTVSDLSSLPDFGEYVKITKLVLFKKTQKLLDRFLFIFFCEDRGLIPANTVAQVIKGWNQLKFLDAYQPLYDRFKLEFQYIDQGHDDPDRSLSVHAYNGGLFKPDAILDKLIIDDDILLETQKLSNYDFESDVSVDILGHIFEHSLTEIEEIQQQIIAEREGTKLDKKKEKTGKRKKDGVFYTPAYITKYIVENTIGRLCEQKKQELHIDDETYAQRNKKKTAKEKETKKRLDATLDQYQQWLLSLKICDPACGSGAFLNAALTFLQSEHRLIDTYRAHIYGHTLMFQYVDDQILENNLYGVDINEESVEIAKLSLWLHTAHPGRKLTSLNNNIKCGNSLIDDPAVAGNKAFHWQKEFPEIFTNGGFDVVIGNPPYVSAPAQLLYEDMAKQRQAIVDCGKYKTLYQKWDLYIPFIELGIRHLCKDNGYCSMIVPYPLTNQLYGLKCRQMLINDYQLIEIVDCTNTKVFTDAVVQSLIYIEHKKRQSDGTMVSIIENECIKHLFECKSTELIQDEKTCIWNTTQESRDTGRHAQMHVLGDYCFISYGLRLNSDEKTARGEFVKEDLLSDVEDEVHCRKLIEGKDIEKYNIKRYHYVEWNTERVPSKLVRPTFSEFYEHPKLFCNYLGSLTCVIDRDNRFIHTHLITGAVLWRYLHGIENKSILSSIKKFSTMKREDMEELSSHVDLRYLLAVMNSRYAAVLLTNLRGGDYHIYPEHIRNLPIPCPPQNQQQPLIDLADAQLAANKNIHSYTQKFLNRAQSTLGVTKITEKLGEFYKYDFSVFLTELKKQKIKLSLRDQDEWEDYFDSFRQDCTRLLLEIEENDRKIDQLVYGLYGLTEEEIAIVEGK